MVFMSMPGFGTIPSAFPLLHVVLWQQLIRGAAALRMMSEAVTQHG